MRPDRAPRRSRPEGADAVPGRVRAPSRDAAATAEADCGGRRDSRRRTRSRRTESQRSARRGSRPRSRLRNTSIVTPAKSKPAESLEDFRGNYLYNLLDDNMRRFNAEIAQFVLWDDHEVHNNWYPSVRSTALAGRARRAFLEYNPLRLSAGARPLIYRSCSYGPQLDVFALDLRTYRGANSENRQAQASGQCTG